MSTEIEVKEKLEHVKKKIMIFEWDKSRNQLNAGKIPLFNELKEQQDTSVAAAIQRIETIIESLHSTAT